METSTTKILTFGQYTPTNQPVFINNCVVVPSVDEENTYFIVINGHSEQLSFIYLQNEDK